MKIGLFEIVLFMEDYFQRKLQQTQYSDYRISICSEDEMIVELENGFSYDMVSFKKEDEVITLKNKPEVFQAILQILEKTRTIETVFNRLHRSISLHSAELLEEELEVPIVSELLEYIIWVAVIAVIALILLKLNVFEPVRNFFHHLF